MSITARNTIDLISTDKVTGDVLFSMSDHLEWDDPDYHYLCLQNKINDYLEYIESGQYLSQFPQYKDRAIFFLIISKYDYPEFTLEFLQKAEKVLSEYGVSLKQNTIKNAPNWRPPN